MRIKFTLEESEVVYKVIQNPSKGIILTIAESNALLTANSKLKAAILLEIEANEVKLSRVIEDLEKSGYGSEELINKLNSAKDDVQTKNTTKRNSINK